MQPLRLGALLAAINGVFWLFLIVVTPSLPQGYYNERDSRVRRVDGRVEMHLVTDVDPMLILADRPFAYPMVPVRRSVKVGLLANLPAFASASIATTLLDGLMVPPRRSTRVAAWVGTVAFFLVSTAQWALIGWLAGRVGSWAARRRRGSR